MKQGELKMYVCSVSGSKSGCVLLLSAFEKSVWFLYKKKCCLNSVFSKKHKEVFQKISKFHA